LVREITAHLGKAAHCGQWVQSILWLNEHITPQSKLRRRRECGLLDADEDALVSFMQTLTDGFMSRDQR
jgi:hypothetical protein